MQSSPPPPAVDPEYGDDNDDMEGDDEIEISHISVDGDPYVIVEDEQGAVVIEGETVDCKR